MTTERRSWRIPTALIALSVIPVVAGSLRVVELSGGPEVLPSDARFTASPLPLVVHVVGAIGYATFGALQFSTSLRRRRPGYHRAAGRTLVVAGSLVAGSGLWMTLMYSQKEGTGDVLYLARLVFSAAMGVFIVLGFAAIRRRDITHHRAWMIRAYALALGAGTQTLTVGFGEAWFGHGVLSHDLSMTSAWIINLAVAEWAIRRPTRPRRRLQSVVAAVPS